MARKLGFLAGVYTSAVSLSGAESNGAPHSFIEAHCASCHDDVEKKGGLDLTVLALNPQDPKNFAAWVKVYDRVSTGEMPPKKKPRPPAAEMERFTRTLFATLTNAERAALGGAGRATQRRLNGHVDESAVRAPVGARWLQIKEGLPEDGEVQRFNKVGGALERSHVNMARYLTVAE